METWGLFGLTNLYRIIYIGIYFSEVNFSHDLKELIMSFALNILCFPFLIQFLILPQDQTQSFELPIKKMMYTYLTCHSHILFLGPLRRYSYGMVLQLVSGVG